MRTLAVALTLTLLLPAVAIAQDPADSDPWPTADELRRDLQVLGYEFEYDAAARALFPEFRPELPAAWLLTKPVVVDAAAPAVADYDAFALQLADYGERPTQVVFTASGADEGDGTIGTISTVLMEVAARLPAGSGMDEAVWFISNTSLHPEGAAERTTLPCVVRESDEATLILWQGRDDEGKTRFFGTVGPYEAMPEEVEACKARQAQASADTVGSMDDDSEAEAVDYTVPPAEAVEMIRGGERTVIDVRTPDEYEQARVVGALNIDFEAPDFAERIAELDPDEPYLLYCRTGRRSNLAAQQMAEAGFTDIVDAAGLVDLARAGAPIE